MTATTEEVELKACRFVEDRLTWHDHDIPSTAVRRVEFQKNAKQTSDFLEETVVEMMLKWGFYGHTADQGLRPASTRQWVASVWEYPYLLQAWNTVKDSDEPLIELLHRQLHSDVDCGECCGGAQSPGAARTAVAHHGDKGSEATVGDEAAQKQQHVCVE